MGQCQCCTYEDNHQVNKQGFKQEISTNQTIKSTPPSRSVETSESSFNLSQNNKLSSEMKLSEPVPEVKQQQSVNELQIQSNQSNIDFQEMALPQYSLEDDGDIQLLFEEDKSISRNSSQLKSERQSLQKSELKSINEEFENKTYKEEEKEEQNSQANLQDIRDQSSDTNMSNKCSSVLQDVDKKQKTGYNLDDIEKEFKNERDQNKIIDQIKQENFTGLQSALKKSDSSAQTVSFRTYTAISNQDRPHVKFAENYKVKRKRTIVKRKL